MVVADQHHRTELSEGVDGLAGWFYIFSRDS
jgi:hypothetical protein